MHPGAIETVSVELPDQTVTGGRSGEKTAAVAGAGLTALYTGMPLVDPRNFYIFSPVSNAFLAKISPPKQGKFSARNSTKNRSLRTAKLPV